MSSQQSGPESYSGHELEVMALSRRYQRWVADQFISYVHGNVMEIGAGIGTMARMWLGVSKELHLVEPARNLFPKLSVAFDENPNVTTHCGELSDILLRHPDLAHQAFDTIIMINVLEHVADDESMLETIYRMLAPRGCLLIFVPALPALFGSVDVAVGHYRRYTKSQLTELCRRVQFEVIQSYYFDMLGILPWWFIGRVLRVKTLGAATAGVYDALGVPVARVIESIVSPPIGKNLVFVLRKA